MNATLRSMSRVPHTRVKKVFAARNADHADQTTLGDREVISVESFTAVQDAPAEPGPLRTIADRIADHPAPPAWSELSALRWGPAMDEDRPWVVAADNAPGIVINVPDHGRLMAALRANERRIHLMGIQHPTNVSPGLLRLRAAYVNKHRVRDYKLSGRSLMRLVLSRCPTRPWSTRSANGSRSTTRPTCAWRAGPSTTSRC